MLVPKGHLAYQNQFQLTLSPAFTISYHALLQSGDICINRTTFVAHESRPSTQHRVCLTFNHSVNFIAIINHRRWFFHAYITRSFSHCASLDEKFLSNGPPWCGFCIQTTWKILVFVSAWVRRRFQFPVFRISVLWQSNLRCKQKNVKYTGIYLV